MTIFLTVVFITFSYESVFSLSFISREITLYFCLEMGDSIASFRRVFWRWIWSFERVNFGFSIGSCGEGILNGFLTVAEEGRLVMIRMAFWDLLLEMVKVGLGSFRVAATVVGVGASPLTLEERAIGASFGTDGLRKVTFESAKS